MKKIKILISLLVIFTLQVNVVHAQSIEQNEMSPYNRLEEKIELKKGPVLEINNTYNPLFWEFTNKKDAFSYVKDNYDEILLEISEKEKLDSLNYSNWEKYYLSLQNNYIFSENTPYKLDDIMFLNEFFVVCENEEINQKALEIIKKENYSINELENYIPYTSPILVIIRVQQLTMRKLTDLIIIKNIRIIAVKIVLILLHKFYLLVVHQKIQHGSHIQLHGQLHIISQFIGIHEVILNMQLDLLIR